jgi:two-component system, NarL family, response regulator YdfI
VIRLLIAARSAALREGLEALAASRPEFDVAGSHPDLSSAEDLHPDVILAMLPLSEIGPPANGRVPAIVLLSGESHPVWTQDALRFGVRAVLPRGASHAEILAALEAAAAGFAVVEARDLDHLLASASPAPAASESSDITPRELEVLRMMAEGAANKVIAWKLDISEHTVKFHVASILARLGAGSRTEAVTMGIRKGLVLL